MGEEERRIHNQLVKSNNKVLDTKVTKFSHTIQLHQKQEAVQLVHTISLSLYKFLKTAGKRNMVSIHSFIHRRLFSIPPHVSFYMQHFPPITFPSSSVSLVTSLVNSSAFASPTHENLPRLGHFLTTAKDPFGFVFILHLLFTSACTAFSHACGPSHPLFVIIWKQLSNVAFCVIKWLRVWLGTPFLLHASIINPTK